MRLVWSAWKGALRPLMSDVHHLNDESIRSRIDEVFLRLFSYRFQGGTDVEREREASLVESSSVFDEGVPWSLKMIMSANSEVSAVCPGRVSGIRLHDGDFSTDQSKSQPTISRPEDILRTNGFAPKKLRPCYSLNPSLAGT